jgi:hypothetical protein
MLKRIGIFEIDKDISANYNEYILKSVDDKASLDFLASDVGIKKMFKGEKFFHAIVLDDFLGRKAFFNLIGTIDNKIYKIYFKFFDSNRSDCISFRNEIKAHVAEYTSPQEFNNNYITKVKDGRLLIWHFDWGNFLLEELYISTEEGEAWSTAVSVTSNAIKNAKKLTFFDKVFNRL